MSNGSESDVASEASSAGSSGSRRRISFPAQVRFQSAVQQQDNVELARILSQHGPRLDINFTNHSGMSLLQQAVLNRNLDTVKLLLCQGAECSTQDIHGYSPLHSAAACGFRQAASLLIIFGADMFLMTHDGDMPIDLAKDNATIDMLTHEMRNQLSNQILNDKYGFIFRAIRLWESFLEWSKAFVMRTATAIWEAALSQYQQMMEQREGKVDPEHTPCNSETEKPSS